MRDWDGGASEENIRVSVVVFSSSIYVNRKNGTIAYGQLVIAAPALTISVTSES